MQNAFASIFHIATRAGWEASVRRGRYVADSLASEGFIHCSTRVQVLGTANRYYRGQSGLVLLRVEPMRLSSRLEYEAAKPPDGSTPRGDLFPHVYGPLDVHALSRVADFVPSANGEFAWPSGIDELAIGDTRSPADNLVDKDDGIRRFWSEFCTRSGVAETAPYQAWYFGDGAPLARELADLVVSGRKRATATLLWSLELHPPLAPVPGAYSVITEFDSRPRAVIRTTSIDIRAFRDVDAEYAAEEGEGDRTLETWRRDHIEYFSRDCAFLGRKFIEDTPVVLERFERLA